MITHRVHRWLFGRCEHCGKRFAKNETPRMFVYFWNGWLSGEDGLYHTACLEQTLASSLVYDRQRRRLECVKS